MGLIILQENSHSRFIYLFISTASSNEGPTALVTTGEGKFFSNGLDLAWLAEHLSQSESFLLDYMLVLAHFLEVPVPTVAAINGTYLFYYLSKKLLFELISVTNYSTVMVLIIRRYKFAFFFGVMNVWSVWHIFNIFRTISFLAGHCYAGGMLFALAHDYRVMREDRGFLCLPEIDLGFPLAPGMYAIFFSLQEFFEYYRNLKKNHAEEIITVISFSIIKYN